MKPFGRNAQRKKARKEKRSITKSIVIDEDGTLQSNDQISVLINDLSSLKQEEATANELQKPYLFYIPISPMSKSTAFTIRCQKQEKKSPPCYCRVFW